MKTKLLEWWRRYWLAELLSLIMAMVSSRIVYSSTHSLIISAFISTWLTNAVFYATIAYRDLHIRKHKPLTLTNIAKTIRNIVLEFGPAEYLDSFVLRPFYLSFFPFIITNYSFAIFLGTIASDITFYIPTIFSYEMRKKYLSE